MCLVDILKIRNSKELLRVKDAFYKKKVRGILASTSKSIIFFFWMKAGYFI
jgi:hypothetical protein